MAAEKLLSVGAHARREKTTQPMAMAPAAISASPATTMTSVEATAPDNPAANANGTVSPSAMPMTTSLTDPPGLALGGVEKEHEARKRELEEQ